MFNFLKKKKPQEPAPETTSSLAEETADGPAAAPAQAPTINDVLAASYLEVKAPPEATLANTALLLIDIQHLAEPAHLKEKAVKAGMAAEAADAALADYKERFEAALANCEKVLTAARAAGVPPIHVKIQSMCKEARDTGALHRRMGWTFPDSDPATRFLDGTKPLDTEIVITKTASGAFTGTPLDWTLRNMGVEHLIVCGFVADECVETTMRTALDLGYVAKVVADATTTYRAEDAAYVVAKFTGYGFAQSAEDTVKQFEAMGA